MKTGTLCWQTRYRYLKNRKVCVSWKRAGKPSNRKRVAAYICDARSNRSFCRITTIRYSVCEAEIARHDTQGTSWCPRHEGPRHCELCCEPHDTGPRHKDNHMKNSRGRGMKMPSARTPRSISCMSERHPIAIAENTRQHDPTYHKVHVRDVRCTIKLFSGAAASDLSLTTYTFVEHGGVKVLASRKVYVLKTCGETAMSKTQGKLSSLT